ncbi:MAG: type II toxin-antitoxin system VapC family toxin [Gammaproteobacteria bacterium]|nr:type II toxin-antitoxin system VapC family toxin [Gammaproteobacteria bacterium]MDE0415126.1 type II toxin-antitoxin system VapC family toxin [Gammaproteobacteria bacterium]
MRLLLDTHAFLWWLAGSKRLPVRVRHAIRDDANSKLISAASAWEITTKHRLGKLPDAGELAQDITGAITGQGFDELPITVQDAARAGGLPGPHRDPFDRVLIAQSLALDLVLVSNEDLFDRYGVRRLW